MTRRTALILCAALAATVNTALAAQYVVIVNDANPAAWMSKKEVVRLFLKQTPAWPTGQKALPVDLDARSPVRAVFTTDVHGRPVAAVQGYWNLKVFSASEVPPPQKTSDAQVVQFVAANPGAIGYVSPSAQLQGVKVLRVVD